MKKLILTFAVILISIVSATAQAKVTKDANGNFVAAKREVKEKAKETGKTFTDAKGNVYPVLESTNGKLFVVRTSKAGNEYRMYLKTEENSN